MPNERRINPVQRSLSRPLTILGAERKLFFFAMCLGAATFNLLGSLAAVFSSSCSYTSSPGGPPLPTPRFSGYSSTPQNETAIRSAKLTPVSVVRGASC